MAWIRRSNEKALTQSVRRQSEGFQWGKPPKRRRKDSQFIVCQIQRPQRRSKTQELWRDLEWPAAEYGNIKSNRYVLQFKETWWRIIYGWVNVLRET